MTWYTFAILATLVWGMQNFLYKVSAHYKCNTAWTTLLFGVTSAGLATIALFFSNEPLSGQVWLLLIFAFVSSIAYSANNILKIEALKHIDTSVMFPITRAGTAVAVGIAILFLSERPTALQIIGIILSIVVVYLVANDPNKKIIPDKNFKLGITLSLLALVSVVGSIFATKYGAVLFNNFAFIAMANAFNAAWSFAGRKKLQMVNVRNDHEVSIVIGIAIGFTHFLGAWLLLRAFELGPLSTVQAVKSLSFVVAVILGVLIYKEEINAKRIAGIALAVLAAILLR